MKNYISVNVVSQSLLLVKIIQKHNCFSVHDARQLKLPYGVRFDIALSFALQCNWLKEIHGLLELTRTGNEVSMLFDGEQICFPLWKVVLWSYISICHPAWAKRIPYGRAEAFLFMNEEEQRCFIEAGLINSLSKEVIEWWDALAANERTKVNASLDQFGRQGERLTMEFEERRTGIKPDWRSVETNLSGYDILSHRSATDMSRLLIEVKSSSKTIYEANAIISRHEWEVACLRNNRQCYLFHLWSLNYTEPRLAIISAEEIAPHIPKDSEFGIWKNASIPFKVFAEKFSAVLTVE